MNWELGRRIGFTVGALLVFLLGTYIPLPGIEPEVLVSGVDELPRVRHGIRGGAPYGGACLPKDTCGFLGFAAQLGVAMPLLEAVSIPSVAQFLNDDGEIVPNEIMDGSADLMLRELLRWSEALKTLRTPAP